MWQKVCETDQLAEGNARSFVHEDLNIGVFRTADGLFAIDNVCPHHQAELHMGTVKDGLVFCPWHAWPFHLKDGRCDLHSRFNVETYPVKEEGGAIWVDPSRAVRL